MDAKTFDVFHKSLYRTMGGVAHKLYGDSAYLFSCVGTHINSRSRYLEYESGGRYTQLKETFLKAAEELTDEFHTYFQFIDGECKIRITGVWHLKQNDPNKHIQKLTDKFGAFNKVS
jgi:hypothetical protein